MDIIQLINIYACMFIIYILINNSIKHIIIDFFFSEFVVVLISDMCYICVYTQLYFLMIKQLIISI